MALNPTDRVDLAMFPFDHGGLLYIRKEGWPGTGAMLVEAHRPANPGEFPSVVDFLHLVWRVQRFVDGTVEIGGELTHTGVAVRDLLQSPEWPTLTGTTPLPSRNLRDLLTQEPTK